MNVVAIHFIPVEGRDLGSIEFIDTERIPSGHPLLVAIEAALKDECYEGEVAYKDIFGYVDEADTNNDTLIIEQFEVSLPCYVQAVIKLWHE
jgi:hypothetical protein